MSMEKQTIIKPHRRNPFLMGLIALLPTLITIGILILAFQFLNNNIARPLTSGVLSLVEIISGTNLGPWKTNTWVVAFIGFPLAIIIIFLVGYVMATFIGRGLFKILEKWILTKFPIINLIYPHAKQLINMIFSEDRKAAFKMVVAIQYPRLGLYTLGFVTSEGMKSLNATVGKDCISVFVPSSPTPFTGYTVFIPREDVIPLKLTVDEAIRISISGGVLIPPGEVRKIKK